MKHKNVAFFIPHLGCPHQCSFCDQRAISGKVAAPSVGEVEKTLLEASADIADKRGAEIAFFGGSFTAIPRSTMCAYLEAAKPFLGKDGFAGIRISTRPDAISAEILSLLRQYGVTAIELGAQSMKDEVLLKNGRGHTAADVRRAAYQIKVHGFELGLQMMVGLPGDTEPEDALYTAKALLALSPDCMRIYPAVILPHTRLAEWYQMGKYVPMAFDTAVSVCAELLLLFHQNSVPVIRLGLHDSPEVAARQIGGIYHPAFRELCENMIYLTHARTALSGKAPGSYTIEVRPDCISKMAGQHRKNLLILQKSGYKLKICGNPQLDLYEISLKGGGSSCS